MSLRTDSTAPPFARILVANRGEIAVRIMRTCRDLGIQTVAVYSDADVDAMHVRMADTAVRLGPAPAEQSYLLGDAIIAAAVATGAQAIHPGYGFLSERSAFARAVIDAGVVFIGPTPEGIDALGDKLVARRTVSAQDVPVVPGTFEAALVDRPDGVAAIVAAAKQIGFPLMVKAAAGGGGRGMRRVSSALELPAALASGSAEARAAFGDGSVFLEREVRPARHIEVQLLGDQHGTGDCSIQRRHQKLVEESPAPGLTVDERTAVHGMAVRAARAAGLQSAATAEFLFDTERRFWFLEVNARLQVEHGVTELVTDLDIVAEQLWIAAGAPLSDRVHAAAESSLAPERHAVQVRLYAEDPSRAFAPAPGRITSWVMPSSTGVRVDTGIRAGDRVPPDYDAMIAKIMTVGPDRQTAIARMRRALRETEITGIQTTLPFGRAIVSDAAFIDGTGLSTEWVAERWDGEASRTAAAEVAARIAAGVAVAGTAIGTIDELVSVRKDNDRPRSVAGSAESAWRNAGRSAAVDRWPR